MTTQQSEGKRLREIIRVCAFKQHFDKVPAMLQSISMDEPVAVLIAPVVIMRSYRHLFPEYSPYEKRVRAELEQRGEDVEALLPKDD